MSSALQAGQYTALRGRLVMPQGVIDDGLVVMAQGRIVFSGRVTDPGCPDLGYSALDSRGQADGAVADSPSSVSTARPNPDVIIMPGLVDLHNHGGGGASFPDAVTAQEVEQAARVHRQAGTTTLLASLVTASPDTLLARAALLAGAVSRGIIDGIHCEGPFLSPLRAGAQSPEFLMPADPGFVRELADTAGGSLRTMTVAPEVPGVLAFQHKVSVGATTCLTAREGLLQVLVDLGIIPSLGHTAASCEQAELMIQQVAPALRERGLRMTATHLFNGMPPMAHRDPGPVAACLAAAARGDMVVELVADGVHLHPATVRTMASVVGGHAALVTDAMAAAAMPDGLYQLGPMRVSVRQGVARLASDSQDTPDTPDKPNAQDTPDTPGSAARDTVSQAHGSSPGPLAGGTARLIDVVRTTVDGGVALHDAVAMASSVPASVLGLTDRGSLQAGLRADLLVTDANLQPQQVYRAGQLM